MTKEDEVHSLELALDDMSMAVDAMASASILLGEGGGESDDIIKSIYELTSAMTSTWRKYRRITAGIESLEVAYHER